MENIKISPNNNPDNSSNINGFNYDGEKLLRVYRNENESLKTIINHYEATLKCRENLISKYVYDLQENKKIIQKQKKIIISLSSELNTLKNQRLLKEKAPTPKHVSTGLITAKNSQKSKLEHLYMRKTAAQIVTKTQGIEYNSNNFFPENEKLSTFFCAGIQRQMGKQRYHRIEELLKCKGDYFMTFNSFNFLEKEEIVKDFISAYQELAKNAKMNYKLREIITLYRNISRLCTLEEIINMFNKEFPYLFNCYKSHLYVLDELANEIWTATDELDSCISLQLDVKDNAVVYAFLNEKNLKIDDARNDLNFSRNLDHEKKIKIKNLLCYPIKNSDDKTFAIIELINKHDGVFNNEDEELLSLIVTHISTLLSQNIENEIFQLKNSKLMTLMKFGIDFFSCDQIEELILKCEEKINGIMNSDQCSIILVDRENDCFLRMKDKEKQLNQIKNLTIGIVGRCLQTNQVIEISQGKRDIDFNRFIDIETDLPLLTFPITLKDEIIGIAQIINLRKRVGEKFLKKSFFSEKECLDVFSNILGVCLGKLLKKI